MYGGGKGEFDGTFGLSWVSGQADNVLMAAAAEKSVRRLRYPWKCAFVCCFLLCSRSFGQEKPKIAVFPLAGSASAEQREKVGFSLRAKLDRDGHYEVIDGPAMADLVGGEGKSIDLSSSPGELLEVAKDEKPQVMIWGQLEAAAGESVLRLKTFDVDQPDPLPHEFEKRIAQPTDLRFAVEDILQMLDGVRQFSHSSEEAVVDDAAARALFAKNPNLVPDGDLAAASKDSWQALLRAEIYPPTLSDSLPDKDKVVIYRLRDDPAHARNVLAMNLSKDVAESNGLACLSGAIAIEPNTRYRLVFKYRSDGPNLHVFVKGYTTGKDISGQPTERECYRRQVPPSAATDGRWVTITCDLNPQHPVFRVEHLRVDLYAYLKPGVVMFDDVQLKAAGEQTRHAVDDAIRKPPGR